jgi:HK97 family phage major capsid protein
MWMVEDYVKLARAARVTADLMNTQPLPGGVSSINLPAVATGTAVGVTQTQNTAVQNTDITTTSISSGITTISGQQVVSLQLMKQSGIPFDRVILEDLALAYAAQLDTQVLNGSNANGQLKGLAAAGTTVTFTTTTPHFISSTAAGSFYNKLIAAQTNIAKNRYLPADAIVMHPTRWGWALQGLDGQGRLQIAPNGPVFNAPAVTGEPVAQGYAGTLAGLPVYVDPNIPQNLGAATNQDQVFVLRRGDHWLYETPIEATTWEATYASQNSVLFRVLGFAAFITRYSASAQVIDGTGLVTPTL